MAVTEFAIISFYSPPGLSNPGTIYTLLRKLSDWQSDSSGFPLHFFTDEGNPCLVHLVTGWTSVEAHEAWIRGGRNQELRKAFAPYVNVEGVRMAHIDVEWDALGTEGLVVERYEVHQLEGEEGQGVGFVGSDLGQSGDVYRFRVVGDATSEPGEGASPVERWILKRLQL